jgi:kinase
MSISIYLLCIARLTAGGNQLTGNLPVGMSNMPNLQVVWLFKNKFTGPLPGFWADSLLVLDLYDNEMTGTIPVEISGLPNLQQLVLGGNYFTGRIPDEIGDYMVQLTHLNLEANNLTGRAMPASLANLRNLTVLRLGNNAGMEPDFLAEYVSTQWPALEELRLQGLKLRGDLNNLNWRNLGNLRILDLSNNFLKNFPEGITYCDDLEELNLSDNLGMGGNFPDDMDALQNLKHLLVANAGLIGNMSASVGQLSMLGMYSVLSALGSAHTPDFSQCVTCIVARPPRIFGPHQQHLHGTSSQSGRPGQCPRTQTWNQLLHWTHS